MGWTSALERTLTRLSWQDRGFDLTFAAMSKSPLPTLILRDDRFLEHDPGVGHPEHPGRLRAIHESLDADPVPGTMLETPPRFDPRQLGRVHDAAYVQQVAASAGRPHTQFDSDTAASAASWDAALLAAGAVVRASEQVLRGEASGAFALVRPPGHHAEHDRAMGFCFFNNVALAAAMAIEEFGCRRVLILDPDVHHGNGTQNSFYARRDVLYVSSHRYPFYPGTGWFDEVGTGAGEGFTVNLPLVAGLGDADFFRLYANTVGPIVDEFAPDLILVSAGFDTYCRDPMGGMAVTEEGFGNLYALFAQWAARHCPGRLVLALEGGYDPRGLAGGVRAALESLVGLRACPDGILDRVSPRTPEVELRARQTLAPYWASLRSSG